MRFLRSVPGFTFGSALLLAIALFCLSPGGAALAETIVNEICGENASLGAVTTIIIDDGGTTRFGSAVVVKGTYDGQEFYGYCLDAHLGVPNACASDIDITPAVAGASCVATTQPPVVPAGSYENFVNNTAASAATWYFTNGYILPSLADAQASDDWDDEAYFLNEDMGGFAEWTGPDDAYSAIKDAAQDLIDACAGASPDTLPTLTSRGNQQGNLPRDMRMQVQFQTNAGEGISLSVDVRDAELISPADGIAVTDENGIATVTVAYTGQQTGTVNVTGNLPAPIGSAVGSIGGNQKFTVGVDSLILFEGAASATVTWRTGGTAPTQVPVDELPNTGSAPLSGNSSGNLDWLLAMSSILLLAAGAFLIHRRRTS